MSVLGDKSEALRLLSGIESGELSTDDAYAIAEKRDPLLVYFILRYLREKYAHNVSASDGVMSRILELSQNHEKIVAMTKEGEKDILREWFDDCHSTREFFQDPEGFINLIVDKIEG